MKVRWVAVLVVVCGACSSTRTAGPSTIASPTSSTAAATPTTIAPPQASTTVAAATTAAAATSAATTAASASPRTGVTLFQPWLRTGEVKSTITVSQTLTGTCIGPSDASGRPDAFRCSAGNLIFDPCFGSEALARVLCANDPRGPFALVDLDQAPSSGDTQSTARPWFIELQDGTTCSPITGATSEVAGQRVSWTCSDSSSVVGEVDMTTPLWTVQLDRADSSTLVPGVVANAWT